MKRSPSWWPTSGTRAGCHGGDRRLLPGGEGCTTFLRLLDVEADRKGEPLREAIAASRGGAEPVGVFQLQPSSFQQGRGHRSHTG